MNAKELKRVLSDEEANDPALPWWMGLTTLERARAIQAEIEGQVASLAEENRAFRRALARLGFAGPMDESPP